MQTWDFFTAGQLTFGPGAIRQLPEIISRRQLKRIFIVSDRNLQQVGIVDRVAAQVETAADQVDLFLEGEAEPSIISANQCVEAALRFRPDAIVGLGGGSNMDLSKFAAIVVTHGGEARDYFGFDKVPAPILPLICIPTTSGTGSEVSHSAVLTDTENRIKISAQSNLIRPAHAVVDPQLTYGCPREITADSGIDALVHAIECYTATEYDKLQVPSGQESAYVGSFPLGDCLAEKAIALIGQNLAASCNEPDNHAARDAMSLAATVSGMSFSNGGVALVHAMEYPIGGAVHCSHGAGNGLLLPYVMRFNLPARQEKFAKIAELLGRDTRNMSVEAAAEQAVQAVIDLRKAIGIPDKIREFGADREQLGNWASKAFAIQRLMWMNPRLPTEQDLLEIYQQAY